MCAGADAGGYASFEAAQAQKHVTHNEALALLDTLVQLAVLSAAFAGACAGFLWFNAAPARIFMGDVGALAIGTALALLSITTNTHLLLILIRARHREVLADRLARQRR